jgi:hypothetical protein
MRTTLGMVVRCATPFWALDRAQQLLVDEGGQAARPGGCQAQRRVGYVLCQLVSRRFRDLSFEV